MRVICVNDVYTLENLPRLKSLVQHHADSLPADRLLVTLAGDFVAPSILSSLDKGVGMLDCLNAIPITHVMFGNHEDDVGMAELAKRVRDFRGTWLNTNMPTFRPELPAHQILDISSAGGRTVRVGLLGLLTHQQNLYRPGAFGGHAIEPANETAVRWTRRLLEQEGCVCVIPITHQELAGDHALARMQREPRFPIIIAGHEHEVFIDDVDGCWVIKAGAEAANAVVVDLVWPAEAPPAGAPDLPAVTLKLQEVGDFPEDQAMRARVDRHMKTVRQLDGATLLRIPPGERLSSVGIKTRQTSLGAVICSRVRDALEADGCLLHAGGVRGEGDYEERFTYADLKAALPYANETVVVSMPGRVVRDAVAMSRAAGNEGSSGYLQVDDRMTVESPGDVVTAIGGLPLDPDRVYRIATVMGLLGGMDAIEPLIRHARERPETVPPRDSGREIKVILVDAFSLELWRQLGSFEDIDANRDGVVTPEEIKTAVTRVTTEAPAEIVLNDVIRMVDADSDGTITREEAEAIVTHHRAKHPAGATSAWRRTTPRQKESPMIEERHEIETIAELDEHLRSGGSLGGCVFQKLDLRGHTRALIEKALPNALFLGCQLEPSAVMHANATGALFFPDLPNLPYSIYRAFLYNVEELYDGYQRDVPESYQGAFDCRVYRHFSESRKINDIVEELAQRIHDHAVTNALQDFLLAGRHKVASIMGGHALSRADPMYRMVVRLGRELARAGFCVATGGGPGAMEAGHLGAYLATRAEGDIDAALAVLSRAPAMLPIDAWLDAAFEVRARFPLSPEDEARCASVALPTWLYGHEPPNVFATHIAKYFDNSVREEGVLAIGMYGIVFAPGSAGTIQEIFQDAAQNHYTTYGVASPMVFLGKKYWTEVKPVYPLLEQLAAGHDYARWLFISDDVDAIVEHLRAYARERHG